jgi:Tfp pilus assembly protein PilX
VIRRMRSANRSQDGIAMPLALGMLLIVTLVAGGVATMSINASDEARDDRNAKRALAAAETGLQVANLRLNNAFGLAGPACLVGSPTGTECPTYASGDLGNGATYRFWVSQQLAVGDTCGKLPTQTATGKERCITSLGIAGGVERRLQARVLDIPSATSLVPVEGVFALNRLWYKNDTDVDGHVGSNGQIRSDNNLTVRGVRLGPAGTTLGSITYTQPPAAPVVASQPYTLTTVPVGDTATNNQNSSITSGYTAATRTLTAPGGAGLTLTQSGDYNFCKISAGRINLAAGVKARIFLDAPNAARPGSGCPSGDGWGEINASGSFRLNFGGDPTAMQLIVVGWDVPSSYATTYGRATLYFANEFQLHGLLYATNAALDFQGAATATGAAAMYEATFNNSSDFLWNDGADDYGDPSLQYSLQGWRECRPRAANVNDPESGC